LKINSKLKAKIAALTVHQKVTSKGRKTKMTSNDPVVASIEEDIEKLQTLLSDFYSPFIELSTFTHLKLAFAYDHPNCFSEDLLIGTIAVHPREIPSSNANIYSVCKSSHKTTKRP
jgi:hypothetical protein